MKNWIQWFFVGLVTTVFRGVVSGLLDLDPFTIPDLSESIKLHDWSRVTYRMVLELEFMIDSAYFLRAAGLIKFVNPREW